MNALETNYFNIEFGDNRSVSSSLFWGAVGGASGSIIGDLFPSSSSSNNLNWFNSQSAGQKNFDYGFAELNGFTINPSAASPKSVTLGMVASNFIGEAFSSFDQSTASDESSTLDVELTFSGSIAQFNQQQEYSTCNLCGY